MSDTKKRIAREIQLTQGYVATIDDEDYDRVSMFRWTAAIKKRVDGSLSSVYAVRAVRIRPGKWTSQYLHRFILGLSDPAVGVDHRDNNGLNNTRANLRECNQSQNTANSRVCRSNSGVRGVSWIRSRNKWMAYIGVKGAIRNIGYFINLEDAVAARAAAEISEFGEFRNGL